MGKIYKGTGWGSTYVGKCDSGTVYSGIGWDEKIVGHYSDGSIYRGSGWNKTLVGCYEAGNVYRGTGWSKELIGSYNNGDIYLGYGWNKSIVGTYEGVGSEAAAYLLLLYDENIGLPTPGGSKDNTPTDDNHSNGGESESAGKSGGTEPPGGIGCSIEIIGIFVAAVLIALVTYFIYFKIPWTWAFYAMFIIAAVSFVVTNLYIYKKTKTSEVKSDDVVNKGMEFILILSYGLSFVVYIVEMITVYSFTFLRLLTGFVITAVDIFIFAWPFYLVELIILFIVSKRISKK